jgi:PAS domain S-box-containing protein
MAEVPRSTNNGKVIGSGIVDARSSGAWPDCVLDCVSFGVIVCDARGRILSANASAARLLRLGLRELRNRVWDDGSWQFTTFDGRAVPSDECPFAIALRTGSPAPRTELEYRRADGSCIALAVDAEPVRDSDPRSVVITLSDISPQ